MLDLCDERRDLKKGYEAEGEQEYREANRRVQKAVKKVKGDWISAQCEEIENLPEQKQQHESISAQCWKWPVARSPNATKNHSGRPHLVRNTCICRPKILVWATNSESMHIL